MFGGNSRVLARVWIGFGAVMFFACTLGLVGSQVAPAAKALFKPISIDQIDLPKKAAEILARVKKSAVTVGKPQVVQLDPAAVENADAPVVLNLTQDVTVHG